MKVWTNTEFTGHYPVGTAAVCVANTAEEAAAMLNDDLASRGLLRTATASQFVKLATNVPQAIVLLDGNY